VDKPTKNFKFIVCLINRDKNIEVENEAREDARINNLEGSGNLW